MPNLYEADQEAPRRSKDLDTNFLLGRSSIRLLSPTCIHAPVRYQS